MKLLPLENAIYQDHFIIKNNGSEYKGQMIVKMKPIKKMKSSNPFNTATMDGISQSSSMTSLQIQGSYNSSSMP